MKGTLKKGLGLAYVMAVVGNNFGGSIANAMENEWWVRFLELLRNWFKSQKEFDSESDGEKIVKEFIAEEFSEDLNLGKISGSFERNNENKNFTPFCEFKNGMLYGIEEKDEEYCIVSKKIIDGKVVEWMTLLSSNKNCGKENILNFCREVKYIATLAKFEDFLEKNRSLFSLKENSTSEYVVKDGKFNIFINNERLDHFVYFGVNDYRVSDTQVILKCESKESSSSYNFSELVSWHGTKEPNVDRKTATEMLESIMKQTEDYKKKINEKGVQERCVVGDFGINVE